MKPCAHYLHIPLTQWSSLIECCSKDVDKGMHLTHVLEWNRYVLLIFFFEVLSHMLWIVLCHVDGEPVMNRGQLATILHTQQNGWQPDLHWPLSVMPWWRHQMEIFSALLAICAGNSPVTGEFPAQSPVTRSFDVFFFICSWINGWVNNHEFGYLRRHRAHYDVIVME